MYAIKLVLGGEFVGYRADTPSVSFVHEIDRAQLFEDQNDAFLQMLRDEWDLFDDFEIEEL